MEAIDIVLDLVNKNITEQIVVVTRRGPKGYALLFRLRMLLYAMLKEFFFTRELVAHFEKHKRLLHRLGFKRIPHRKTLARWKRNHAYELEQLITLVGDRYLQLSESLWTILDSTPIIDADDPDATLGHNSQGEFLGFKLHMSCDEKEVPLRAAFTQGHHHDCPHGEKLLAPTPKAGADAAYDAEELKDKASAQGTKLITVHNPRRAGKQAKKPTPKILKKVRVCIEQCNGFIKSQVMKHAWTLVKGLQAKATFCLTAVLAIQAIALYNLKRFDYPSIRIKQVRI